jgi:hypothetical protein
MRIAEIVSNNFGLKLLSLLVGSTIYFYVNKYIETTADIELLVKVSVKQEIRFKDDPGFAGGKIEYEVDRESRIQTVIAKFSGPNNRIRILKQKPPVLAIVLGANEKEMSAGSFSIDLVEQQLADLPAEVQLSEIKVTFAKEYLSFNVLEIIERDKKIEVNYDFSDSTLVNVKGVKYTKPGSVKVRGEREAVLNMEFIKTQLIKNIIQDVTQTDIKNVKLITTLEDGTSISAEPDTLSLVRLVVNNWDQKLVLSNVPIKYMASSDHKTVTFVKDKFVTLTISGPPNLEDGRELSKITMDQFQVFIYAEVDENKVIERRVRVWTDLKGISIDVEPKFVKVIVKSK